MVVVDQPDVHTVRLGGVADLRRPAGHPGQDRVEERVVDDLHTATGQPCGHLLGAAMHPPRDRGQPIGTVIARVHRRHHRQQHLRGADIACRLVPPDVLFAGLQRQSVRRGPVGVERHSDEATGQLSGVLGVHGEIAGVRSPESHWHTESLGAAECDVGSDLAGRRDERHGEQVGADCDQRTTVVCLRDHVAPVDDGAAGARQLGDDPEELAFRQALPEVGLDDFDAERLGASGQHGGGLRVNVAVDDQPVRRPAHRPVHQGHRLGGRGALVEHRRVGDLESGEVTDHGLEVQQRLEPALADLRLIRRVSGVPRRVLKYVAAQHRWGQRVEVALPDHRHRDGVGVGERPQFCQRLVFGGRRRELIQTGCHLIRGQRVEDARGQRLVGELVERTHTDGRQHGGDGVGVRSDMARGEGERVVSRDKH